MWMAKPGILLGNIGCSRHLPGWWSTRSARWAITQICNEDLLYHMAVLPFGGTSVGLEPHEVQSQEMQSPVPGESSPRNQYTLQQELRDWMEGSLAEKHPGSCWTKSQQCVPVARADNSILGCTKKSIASRLEEVILFLPLSTGGTPSKFWVHFWAPQRVQGASLVRDHTGDQGLQHLTCVERQRPGAVQPGEDSRVILPFFGSTCWRKVKKTKPNSPQCPLRKIDNGHKLKHMQFLNIGNFVPKWDLSNSRKWFSGKLWSLHSWRCLRPNWSPRQPALGDLSLSKWVVPENLQGCLLFSTILWFSDLLSSPTLSYLSS